MINNLDNINYQYKRNIVNDFYYHNISFNEIMIKYQLTRNELIAILYDANISKKALEKHITDTFIDDKELLIISDTHIGSIYESSMYIDSLLEFAIANNINNILHCGDIIQSTYRPVKKDYINSKKQIERFISIFPDYINVYLLLGNHDYHSLYNKDNLYKIIDSKDNLNILGFKKAYLKWQKYLFTLSHRIDNYKLILPNYPIIFDFVGHRHEFILNESKIFVPSLSNDIKGNGWPGFLYAKLENKELIIDEYVFDLEAKYYQTSNSIIKSLK